MQARQAKREATPVKRYSHFFLSDQHQGIDNPCDDWQRRFLDVMTTEAHESRLPPEKRTQGAVFCDTLVLLGDTDDWEVMAMRGVAQVSEKSRMFRDSLNAAIARGVKVVKVRGNHDDQLRALEGQSVMGVAYAEKLEFLTGPGADGRRKKVLALHGDQFDAGLNGLRDLARGWWKQRSVEAGDSPLAVWASDKARAASRNAVAFGHWLVDKAVNGGTRLARALDIDFNLFGWAANLRDTLNGMKQGFEDSAVRLALDAKADIVITGHTHFKYVRTIPKGALVGSFRKAGGPLPRIAGHDVTFVNDGDGMTSFSGAGLTYDGKVELLAGRAFRKAAGRAPEDIAARNRIAHRATTDAQIAAEYAACFGITAGEPLPRTHFRPKIGSEPESGKSGVRVRPGMAPDVAAALGAARAATPGIRHAAP